MPISVPGSSELRLGARPADGAGAVSACPARRVRGFTLIELLVVLVIVGIAATAVTVQSGAGAQQQALHQDAARLMQRFLAAQNEVRADGRPITWFHDDAGYRFARRAPVPLAATPVSQAAAAAMPPDTFVGDELLQPRSWGQSPVLVEVAPLGAPVFTAEWIAAPLSVRLVAGNASVQVLRDAAGRYRVQ